MVRKKIPVVSLPAVILEDVQTAKALSESIDGFICKAVYSLPWGNTFVVCFDFHEPRKEVSVIDVPIVLLRGSLELSSFLNAGHCKCRSWTYSSSSQVPFDWIVCPEIFKPRHLCDLHAISGYSLPSCEDCHLLTSDVCLNISQIDAIT